MIIFYCPNHHRASFEWAPLLHESKFRQHRECVCMCVWGGGGEGGAPLSMIYEYVSDPLSYLSVLAEVPKSEIQLVFKSKDLFFLLPW